MNVVHLTASTFHGGPERQMLGLARSLVPDDRTLFLSFAEGGRCRHFLGAARKEGVEALGLEKETPRARAAVGGNRPPGAAGRRGRDRRPPRPRPGGHPLLSRLQGGPPRPARRPPSEG